MDLKRGGGVGGCRSFTTQETVITTTTATKAGGESGVFVCVYSCDQMLF